MPSTKPRHNLHLDADLTRRLAALAGRPGMSKARIVEAALRSYFEKAGADTLDSLLQTRMTRLSGQLDRVERDQRIVAQTLAEFIRHHFLVTAAPPESELAFRRAQAEARYASFIETVGRQLAAGRQTKAAPGGRRMSRALDTDESRERRAAMLRTAMGPSIAAALADPLVVEVMVNPDGLLRLDRLGEGRSQTDVSLTPGEVERVIRVVASHMRLEAHAGNPIISAELPPRDDGEAGERFEGLLPPVSTAPCFSIRKPARRIYGLGDYVTDRIMTDGQASALRKAVLDRKNILVAGGTSSGKTTLANALLAEVAQQDERVILIEDTRELQCAARDCVALRTRAGVVSLADLVRSTLRLRPDRIIVGEVRGAEALDMLKAWNTGHPGGIATVHANSAESALYRLEQLIQEVVTTVPRRLIAEAIDTIVFISGRGIARRIETISQLDGLDSEGNYRLSHIHHQWLKAL